MVLPLPSSENRCETVSLSNPSSKLSVRQILSCSKMLRKGGGVGWRERGERRLIENELGWGGGDKFNCCKCDSNLHTLNPESSVVTTRPHRQQCTTIKKQTDQTTQSVETSPFPWVYCYFLLRLNTEVCLFVSWCFKPSQLPRITSGLKIQRVTLYLYMLPQRGDSSIHQ